MAHLPKPERNRTRPNRGPQGAALPAEGRPGRTPPLGNRPGGGAWLQSTKDWWKAVWASPPAAQWLEADRFALQRLALILDRIAGGEDTAALHREARAIEDNFGLSPYGRRRMLWTVNKDAPRRPTKVKRRVKAVDADFTVADILAAGKGADDA